MKRSQSNHLIDIYNWLHFGVSFTEKEVRFGVVVAESHFQNIF